MIDMPNACPTVKPSRRVVRINEFTAASRSCHLAAVPAWACFACLSTRPDQPPPMDACKLLLIWQMAMGTDVPNTGFAIPAAGGVARLDMFSSLGDGFSTAVCAEFWFFGRRALIARLLSPQSLALAPNSVCRSQKITEQAP